MNNFNFSQDELQILQLLLSEKIAEFKSNPSKLRSESLNYINFKGLTAKIEAIIDLENASQRITAPFDISINPTTMTIHDKNPDYDIKTIPLNNENTYNSNPEDDSEKTIKERILKKV